MKKGIDVSEWQGKIDWDKVKNEIDFCIIRAGYGNNDIDAALDYNVKMCEKYKIPYGFYWFSYAANPEEAKKEAHFFVETIHKYAPTYPLYFDYEYDSERYNNGTTSKNLRLMAKSFCDELEKNGYYAGIYTNYDYLTRYGAKIKNRYDIWLAAWGETEADHNMWQFSPRGKIDGIKGDVDLNFCKINYPKIIKDANLNIGICPCCGRAYG